MRKSEEFRSKLFWFLVIFLVVGLIVAGVK